MTKTEVGDGVRAEGLREIDGAEFYVIPGVDRMAPFLMSVVSDGDRWMFVSSTGSLTAGRGDASNALFPYETDDRLHAAAGRVGPVTQLRMRSGSLDTPWRPFDASIDPAATRCLAKSVVGDAVLFEEHHRGLGVTFRYVWRSVERFGFVRTATLVNEGTESVRVDVLDGLLNIMPHGIDPDLHGRLSNLSNAYKRSELIDDRVGLAVYSLESPVSDKPEPEEVLRATVAWSFGLPGATVTLDPRALEAPGRHGADSDRLVTGRPGAYLLRGTVDLEPHGAARWRTVADVAKDQFDVVELRRTLAESHDRDRDHDHDHDHDCALDHDRALDHALDLDLDHALDASTAETTTSLVRIMARADALQQTADRVACAHHFANVTYNVMRGGVPLDGYGIDAADFADFVGQRNRSVADRHRAWLAALPARVERSELAARVAPVGDPHLTRLAREYLPLSFSRRHGDPSRPWNQFSIRIRSADGRPLVYYEGNWRDVFQNWEALGASFPELLPDMVAIFLNASTADGFNPYRITRDGIDWEVPDPDDPWANIGYWGDHQIVYLLRLLRATDRHYPGRLGGRLAERTYTYADVPYRLTSYDELIADPKATIRYDEESADRSAGRVSDIGGDGRLVPGADGEPRLVTLLEKLLVPALAKLSNFVPGGGIWMNTQRPEWNDANNALVGYGLSMVTLFHLREYLAHLRASVAAAPAHSYDVSGEIVEWFDRAAAVFGEAQPEPRSGSSRARLMDALGRAYGDYRSSVYRSGLSAPTALPAARIVELCDLATAHLDATAHLARRPDGLFHSYNLIRFSPTGVGVEHLPEMLEGQVAALGSGALAPDERADLVEALFASSLYRPDQRTFLLAPIRHLPSFVERNVVPAAEVARNPLLSELLASGEPSILRVDADGTHRFDAGLVDEGALDRALDTIAADDAWRELVADHRAATQRLYDDVFRHRSHIGRSGSMYAYEGIGSVYWHMVTKLLLAIAESAVEAAARGAERSTVDRLVDGYRNVRDGLGYNKTAREFGAIPTDPYSHTPAHAGAQQPGMTGAVKEELLARPLELAARVADGEIVFDTTLLRREEMIGAPSKWRVLAVGGEHHDVELRPGSLGFTLCQVPIVVSVTATEPRIEVALTGHRSARIDGMRLGRDLSAAVFGRTGEVQRIDAWVAEPSE